MSKKNFIRGLLLLAIMVGTLSFTHFPSRVVERDILKENRDTTVNPATDFFKYANGGWLSKHPIPPTESSNGIGRLVSDEIDVQLKTLNEKSARLKAPAGSEAQKIGDFYASAMDSSHIEKLSMLPLAPYLKQIESAPDLRSFVQVSAGLRPMGVSSLFECYIAQDDKNSEKMQVQLYQGGIGLPNRDYYFNKDTHIATVRLAYAKHVPAMLRFLADPSADSDGAKVIDFERSLATLSRKLEDLRDPYANYHKMNRASLAKLTPGIEWSQYFSTLGLKNVDSVIVGQPEFFSGLDALLKKTPLPILKKYLEWQLISTFAQQLPAAVAKEDFHFYATVLSGQAQQKPRWKRAIAREQEAMGMLLGKLYISNYFGEAVKKRYEQVVNNVINAYAERIQKLTWMGSATKQTALTKLHSIRKKVSYPDHWRNYDGLTIDSAAYCVNLMNANRFNFLYMVNKYGKPVDRTEWDMTPQTYNAYYNPSNNEIVLPAAQFIVPGMKDEDLDDALVYGYAAASTIGHEITHGFDDQGRQFDQKGNLRNWWSAGDAKQFNQRAQKIVNQFDAFVVLDSLHVNGKACQGENIADLGGLLIGLDAFKKTEQFKKDEHISGMSPTQRYFLGYALGWLYQEKDENLVRQILSDVHAPPYLRVNGPLSNVADFYMAFAVKKGDKMYLPVEKRVSIW